MSNKRNKRRFAAKREARRLKRLAEGGRSANGVELPPGAVPAHHSQHVPNNSYSPPPDYYVDVEFTCKDCGRQEVWTAQQQKWYYEVAKGSLYATAVRCRACRDKLREQRRQGGDPNPIKHVGALLKRVRLDMEPALAEAGFEFAGRNRASGPEPAWLDYCRPGMLFRCLYDPRDACLIAESLDEESGYRIVAITDMDAPESTPALLERIDVFTSTVARFLGGLPPVVATKNVGGD